MMWLGKSLVRVIHCAVVALGLWLHGHSVTAQDGQPASATSFETRFAAMELLLCFQGKGSCLPYDAGVLHEAYARIPALRQGHAIVAGNSSGAIPAAYFCCHGFSDATVRYAEERLTVGNRDAVRNMENVNNKISKLARGLPTEIAHATLREYIAFALGVQHWQDTQSIDEIVRRSTVKPTFPCLIVACNKEVLEDRYPGSSTSPGRLKEFDLANFQVAWKPEVFEYYRQHPDRFVRDHPELVLKSDRNIGAAVTFFVDRSMYDLLSRIPANERTADLRLMSDAADVALAILASVSEPTYFAPVVDPRPQQILCASGQNVLEAVRRRSYYGGYIVSIPAQDVRRMLPGIHVLGTGWRHNPLVARTLLKNWLLADCEEVAYRSEWWADLEVNPDAEFESHIEFRDLTGQQEYQFGLRRAKECFDSDVGLPVYIKPPHYRNAADAAILPARPTPDMFTNETGAAGQRELKTMRGIRALYQPR